jgi:hypothetical protein
MTSSCKCAGTGWLCEEHPDKPMGHGGCSGAGGPCAVCNLPVGNDLPDLPPGFRID